MMKKLTLTLTTLLCTGAALAAIPEPDFAPPAQGQQVVLNIPQLRLFLYQDGKLVKSYQVAVGKKSTQTPLGEYKIGPKAYNPTWSVPKSIQKEMAKTGKPVLKSVAPGPQNPLGPVFVRLGDPRLGLGIHGTNAPTSVPGVRSHGCVRMQSPNALDFAKTVNHGADAAVIYQLASVNVDNNADVWLVAYRDPYARNNLNKTALTKSIAAWAAKNGKHVDSKRINTTLDKKANTLICVTCQASKTKVDGILRPLAWTSGKGELIQPKATQSNAPDGGNEPDELPEGSSIEVDAEPVKPIPPNKAAKPSNRTAVPGETTVNPLPTKSEEDATFDRLM